MGSGAGTDESSYDLFLSYNSGDHKIVEEVAHKLADAGVKRLFLDRWNLLIGTCSRSIVAISGTLNAVWDRRPCL
jgi:hypothetical protein